MSEETPEQAMEREAREAAEDAETREEIHASWRKMETGRLRAFTRMAEAMDAELGANAEPDEATYTMESRERVLDALRVLMLPAADPIPSPLDKILDALPAGFSAAASALAANPQFTGALTSAMAKVASVPMADAYPAPEPSPAIDPRFDEGVAEAKRAADAMVINMFIDDLADPELVSDEMIVALNERLVAIAAKRKIGSFAEPPKPA